MRLIGTVETEKQAFVFYSFLLTSQIHSTYEKQSDGNVAIWIYEEDQTELAVELLDAYKSNPFDPKYEQIAYPETPPQPPDLIARQKEEEARKKGEEPKPPKKKSHPLTLAIIILCSLLFLWNGAQQIQLHNADGKLAVELAMTPLQQKLMFDYPQSAQAITAFLAEYSLKDVKEIEQIPPAAKSQLVKIEAIPTWQGLLNTYIFKKPAGPLFEKIGQGQVWRLFTPIFLHAGLLHLAFNMAWAFILMRPIEERLSIPKILLLIAIIALISNLAQYFMSGPFFLGYSGVVVGLVGFIWMRQKVAPWEGYPLPRSTIIFILVYVLAMVGLEIFSIGYTLLAGKTFPIQIANTAHVVGGLTGLLMGRLSLFERSHK